MGADDESERSSENGDRGPRERQHFLRQNKTEQRTQD